MTQHNEERISQRLAQLCGVAVAVHLNRSGEGVIGTIRPVDLPENGGFQVQVQLGWRHVVGKTQFENFARDLLQEICAATDEKLAQFHALAKLAEAEKGKLSLTINGGEYDPFDVVSWPQDYYAFDLAVERTPVLIDHSHYGHAEELFVKWGGMILAMIVSLLPTEDTVDDLETKGYPEGARQLVEVNRYERNPINRAICLSHKGNSCSVCGFDFEKVAGSHSSDDAQAQNLHR